MPLLHERLNVIALSVSFPQTIVSKMNSEHDLVLSHGYYELQRARLNAIWFRHFNLIATDTASDKIIETIRYIIFNLKFIPRTITIYEDRPEYFIEYKSLIEKVLWTKVVIKKVTMRWNDEEPIIEEV